jgi:hypothetical protein
MQFFVTILLLVAVSCGQNPHLKIKPKVGALDRNINPITVSAELILREKSSKKEGVVDFGNLKKGEVHTRQLELVNVGQINATGISIPTEIGSFSLDNLNCTEVLERAQSCDLNVKINPLKEGIESGTLVVGYDPVNEKPQKNVKSFILANIQAEPLPQEVKLAFIPKNYPTGLIVLKDIPLFEKRRIELELRNVSETAATNLRLSELPLPYRMISTNCGQELLAGAFCALEIEYSSDTVREDSLTLTATSKFSGSKAVQEIKANAVKLNLPAKIEVVDGEISQDIYEILGVKPESLSPFHEVRGVDVGILTTERPIRFNLKLKNIGDNAAKITQIKHLETSEFKYTLGNYPGEKGTCSLEIQKGDCVVEILVAPKEIRNISDLLELTYEDGNGNTRRLSILLLASVREKQLIACKTISARSNAEQREVVKRLMTLNSYKLPYKTNSSETDATLQTLFNLESNMTVRSQDENSSYVIPTVKNAMVQFGFDISKNELNKYSSVKIELDILKVGTEGSKFDTTEVLCLNENRLCSGTFFIDSNFGPLKTSNYKIYSQLFSGELLRSASENPESLEHIFSLSGNKSLVSKTDDYSVFRLKKRVPLKDLFGETIMMSDSGSGLNLVLADDSLLLGLPKLILETDQDSCPTE